MNFLFMILWYLQISLGILVVFLSWISKQFIAWILISKKKVFWLVYIFTILISILKNWV
jgi:hypothetical protein